MQAGKISKIEKILSAFQNLIFLLISQTYGDVFREMKIGHDVKASPRDRGKMHLVGSVDPKQYPLEICRKSPYIWRAGKLKLL